MRFALERVLCSNTSHSLGKIREEHHTPTRSPSGPIIFFGPARHKPLTTLNRKRLAETNKAETKKSLRLRLTMVLFASGTSRVRHRPTYCSRLARYYEMPLTDSAL